MHIKNIRSFMPGLIWLLITLALVVMLNRKTGDIPPLGKFLDPYHGYLALVASDNLPSEEMIFSNLLEPVTVRWDENRIPHIFAENNHDLFFVQGYVMAFDRLWQLDFQTLATAGRMSEIIGEKAIEYDRFQRRIGLPLGAEKAVSALEKDPETLASVQAFVDGVNAYIDQLPKDQFPIEYKILDYAPEYFSVEKTTLLLKNMAWTLTGRSSDLPLTRLWNQYGKGTVDELFPVTPYFVDPIISEPVIPAIPLITVAPEDLYQSIAGEANLPFLPDERNGSNNWAVSGARTQSGHPILANDPHLTLTLPAIWYIMHLVSPDMNVMGVTIPGAPGIISGFNENIAWGVTNGNDDVMDWYDIVFKDGSKNEYWYDGKWNPTEKKVETIQIRGQSAYLDTIIYTHHGPVVWDKVDQTRDFSVGNMRNPTQQVSTGRALRWRGHDETEEIRALLSIDVSDNYDEFVHSLEYFVCPGQNFVYADVAGNIAMWHSGSPPLRWEGQGRFISDGTDPAYDWKQFLPMEHMPHEKNPSREFVSSANQNPVVDPEYPYYLSDNYWMSWRGARINERLSEMSSATLLEVVDVQNDNISILARTVLPIMLNEMKTAPLSDKELKIVGTMKDWDHALDHDSWQATLFYHWLRNLEQQTWSDEFGLKKNDHNWPYLTELAEIIEQDKNARWFDDVRTDTKESFSDICLQSFHTSIQELTENFGSDPILWNWEKYRGTDIHHLAKIPGFGRLKLPTSGGDGVPNATHRTFGPSWRYAVEMGLPVIGIGIYPGGQSGFPGSTHYDDFVNRWVDGKHLNLHFTDNPEDIPGTEVTFSKGEK
ncbi:MAG: penicillin acylase family protein [Candidatus Marinimicrobia bacterium]|nr:penicillin acylase family protein [Candidatus Neomarinimicrobiota bacterium]